MNVVVVGAGVAGLRACEALRRSGYDERLTLVGAEPHRPYNRPPLSKEVLRGEVSPERTALRTPEEYDALGLELRLGTAATALSPDERVVTLAGGEPLGYDRLVIATGTTPRSLSGAQGLAGVHLLRTLDDALALQADLARAERVVVIGAGFIGAEVAASARESGRQVTLVEALPVPLAAALGAELGAALARWHAEHGVDLRTGVTVTGFDGTGRVEAVRLGDGSRLPADLVVVGIGVRPDTDWLRSSGLALDDGVVCDAWCRTSAEDVFAVGDVARWHNPLFDEPMRVEHWTTAGEQGMYVGRTMFEDDPEPFAAVPYFWSDQYDLMLSYLGRPGGGDEMRIVHGSMDGPKFVAVYRHGKRLGGVLGLGTARLVMKMRPLLEARASWDDALAVAAEWPT